MKKFVAVTLALLASVLVLAQTIETGPWVTAVRENTVTILWTTAEEGIGFVEMPDGRRIYDTFAGRREFSTLHTVQLRGLEPGSVVFYRVGGQPLTDSSNPRYPEFGGEYLGEWHSVRTFDSSKENCRITIFNDIHNRVADYSAMAAQVDSATTDFIFLNGDICSTGNHDTDTLARYEIRPLGSLATGVPVMFARGNHEGRGTGIRGVAAVFPRAERADGDFFYIFRAGPVAFIVLDAGETGPGRSELYCGSPVYEDYIAEQAAWAVEAMASPLFRDAPVKICFAHVPFIDHPDPDDCIVHRYMNKVFAPLLNEAGVDLMIGADLHTHYVCDPGTMGNDFSIWINKDAERLVLTTDGRAISLESFSASGKPMHSAEFVPTQD